MRHAFAHEPGMNMALEKSEMGSGVASQAVLVT